MKLKNKETGEIGYPYFQNWKEITCVIVDENAKQIAEYTSLAELNEEWEDYEKKKDVNYWYIDDLGKVNFSSEIIDEVNGTPNNILIHKVIGNYFETEEEAELAVEKLKAWKRLKDKGFKFIGVRGLGKVIDFDIPEPYNHIWFDKYNAKEDEKEFYDDLLLIFGGEE